MEYVIIFLVELKSSPIIGFWGLVILGGIISIFFPKRAVSIFVILFLGYLANIFMGHFVTNYLLERFGDKGEGMVVAIDNTSSTYNDQPVMKYEVMLKSDNQKPVSTYFLSSDFNIVHQKSWNEYVYPSTGIRFNVYYLKGYPRAFVIIADDGSDYAKGLESDQDLEEISRLQNQLKMDPDNDDIRNKLNNLLEKHNNNRK
jgi:hypothetical protein